jgi:peptide/nickel transport system permease protein
MLLKFLLKRGLTSLFIVWGTLSLIFLIIHLAPGDPASIFLRPDINPATVENIRKQMGLDLPLGQQYLIWLKESISGNLGYSFMYKRPVTGLLMEGIHNTLQLTTAVLVLQSCFGIVIGVILAVKRNTSVDLVIGNFLLLLYSLPGFWLALMAIRVFSLKLGWLPSSQIQSLGLTGGFFILLVDRVWHLILPATVLALPFIASTARFVRGSFAEVVTQNYIRTAYAYGIRPFKILFKYALKNALLPLVTLLGLQLPFLLGGAVITEYIFALPGIGTITVNAIFAHDFPVILGTCFISAMAVVFGNHVSDLLYYLADPRIRLGTSNHN